MQCYDWWNNIGKIATGQGDETIFDFLQESVRVLEIYLALK